MALYRLHKKEWERSVWRQTEAYRSISSVNKPEHVLGKRGHDEKKLRMEKKLREKASGRIGRKVVMAVAANSSLVVGEKGSVVV